ncbi:MAG: FAD-dependent oxidoreductase [Planctomycetaceae bacterium]
MADAQGDTWDVAVLGAGVAGLIPAMQLARRGLRVVVLERERIGNGSTGRAAGLLGQLRGTPEATRLLMDGLSIVRELEQRSGTEIFVQTGSVRVAATPERAREIADLVAMGHAIDFEIEHIDNHELERLLPYMKTDDVLDACYCPTDGHLQPAELAAAYVSVGREAGVEIRQHAPVDAIVIENDRVRGVKCGQSSVSAPVVINASGPWSYRVAGYTDTCLPTAAIGHHYLTTRPSNDHPVDRMSPAIRDRHNRIYSRPESGGLIVGMYGTSAEVFDMSRRGSEFDMSAMKARLDDINVATLIYAAQQRYSWITERTPMSITTGIMTFTPDGKPLCGEIPGVAGLFHCSGFCGHGIVQSPLIGAIMADLIVDGQTEYDITALAADRFFEVDGYVDRAEIESRCLDMHAGYYGHVEKGVTDASVSDR